MNREIKFRAWNGNLKKMFLVNNMNWFTSSSCTPRKPSDLNLTDCEDYLIDYPEVDSHRNVCNKRGIYLMQFTGLLDKNGKEIYESDIIKTSCECGERIVEGKSVTNLGKHNENWNNEKI